MKAWIFFPFPGSNPRPRGSRGICVNLLATGPVESKTVFEGQTPVPGIHSGGCLRSPTSSPLAPSDSMKSRRGRSQRTDLCRVARAAVPLSTNQSQYCRFRSSLHQIGPPIGTNRTVWSSRSKRSDEKFSSEFIRQLRLHIVPPCRPPRSLVVVVPIELHSQEHKVEVRTARGTIIHLSFFSTQ